MVINVSIVVKYVEFNSFVKIIIENIWIVTRKILIKKLGAGQNFSDNDIMITSSWLRHNDYDHEKAQKLSIVS